MIDRTTFRKLAALAWLLAFTMPSFAQGTYTITDLRLKEVAADPGLYAFRFDGSGWIRSYNFEGEVTAEWDAETGAFSGNTLSNLITLDDPENPLSPEITLENTLESPDGIDTFSVLKQTNGAFWVGDPENVPGGNLSFGYPGSVNAEYGLFSQDVHGLGTVYGSEGVVVGFGRQDHWHDGSLVISTQGNVNGTPLSGTQVGRIYTNNKGMHFNNRHIYPRGSISDVFDFDADLHVQDDIVSSGTVTAATFSGSGASLTSLPAGSLTGSILDARLSANVPLKNASNTFSAGQKLQLASPSMELIDTAASNKNWKLVNFGSSLYISETGVLDRYKFSSTGSTFIGTNSGSNIVMTVENNHTSGRGEIAIKGFNGAGFQTYANGALTFFAGDSASSGDGRVFTFYGYSAPAGGLLNLISGTNKTTEFFATGSGSHKFKHSGSDVLVVSSTGAAVTGTMQASDYKSGDGTTALANATVVYTDPVDTIDYVLTFKDGLLVGQSPL